MSPDPLNNLDPEQIVQVLPRHLAGPGPADLHTAWPFPFDEDWTLYRPDENTAYATSSCLRLWTRFVAAPETRGNGSWTIGANRTPFGETTWQITFDATTPVELLHDVHLELLELYIDNGHSDHDRLFEDTMAPYEAYAPLFTRGWSHSVRIDGTQTFRTPDGLGGLRHSYATAGRDTPIWRAWGGNPSEPHWQARFSRGTPTVLAAAFTASLISPQPLHRAVKDLPFRSRPHLYLATTVPKPPIPPVPAPATSPSSNSAARRAH